MLTLKKNNDAEGPAGTLTQESVGTLKTWMTGIKEKNRVTINEDDGKLTLPVSRNDLLKKAHTTVVPIEEMHESLTSSQGQVNDNRYTLFKRNAESLTFGKNPALFLTKGGALSEAKKNRLQEAGSKRKKGETPASERSVQKLKLRDMSARKHRQNSCGLDKSKTMSTADLNYLHRGASPEKKD